MSTVSFELGQRVRVARGTCQGWVGTVMEYSDFMDGRAYVVSFDAKPCGWFPAADLEAI